VDGSSHDGSSHDGPSGNGLTGVGISSMSPGSDWRAIGIAVLLTLVLLVLSSGGLCLFPILVLSWRRGGAAALIATGLSWVLCVGFLMFGVQGEDAALTQGITELTVFAVSGGIFGGLLLRGATMSRAGIWAVLPWVFGSGLLISAALVTKPQEVASVWEQAVVGPFEEVLAELEESDDVEADAQEQLEAFRTFLKEDHMWLLYVAPGFLGSLLVLVLWLNLWVSRILEPGYGGMMALPNWRPPETWFWGLLLGGFLTFAGMTPGAPSLLLAVGLNVLLLGASVYFLAGLSLLVFAARRVGVSQWVLLAVMVVLFISGGLPFLIMVGALDFWLDVRKRWEQRDNRGGSTHA